MWPDIELMIMDLLADLYGGETHTATDTPDELYSHLPFLRVTRYGGDDNRVTDFARVDVDSFATTRRTAFDLAQSSRARLLTSHAIGDLVIDHVRTISAPSKKPWDDSRIRFFGGTYEITTRQTSTV